MVSNVTPFAGSSAPISLGARLLPQDAVPVTSRDRRTGMSSRQYSAEALDKYNGPRNGNALAIMPARLRLSAMGEVIVNLHRDRATRHGASVRVGSAA